MWKIYKHTGKMVHAVLVYEIDGKKYETTEAAPIHSYYTVEDQEQDIHPAQVWGENELDQAVIACGQLNERDYPSGKAR